MMIFLGIFFCFTRYGTVHTFLFLTGKKKIVTFIDIRYENESVLFFISHSPTDVRTYAPGSLRSPTVNGGRDINLRTVRYGT